VGVERRLGFCGRVGALYLKTIAAQHVEARFDGAAVGIDPEYAGRSLRRDGPLEDATCGEFEGDSGHDGVRPGKGLRVGPRRTRTLDRSCEVW
jgi:hypothetical protein